MKKKTPAQTRLDPSFPIGLVLMAACLGLITAACTPKRETKFGQGEGIGLLEISAVDGKRFKLQTNNKIADARFSQAGNPIISPSLSAASDSDKIVNNLPLVAYRSTETLLGDVPLYGREHHEYDLVYKLEQDRLKIYKIGRRVDLPYLEFPYATDIGEKLMSDQLAIPLVGYPVRYVRVEPKKNEFGEASHELTEISVPSAQEATHVRIVYEGREAFEPVRQIDVFPASLFDGEWYFSETLIDSNPNHSDVIVGESYSNQADSRLGLATKIKFLATGNILRGVSVNIDDRLNKSNEVNYLPVLVLPIDRLEYRLENYGSGRGMKGMVDYQHLPETRPYMQVGFANVQSLYVSNRTDTKLIDLEISHDYISFTIMKTGESVRYKYALRRVEDRGYEARRYFTEDMHKFGFFTVKKPRFKTWEMDKQEDFERDFLMQRFNPKNDIVYRFAQGSPGYLRQAGRDAIHAWNQAFRDAGSKVQVRLEEAADANDLSLDVPLGDLRYNAINLVSSISDGDLLGFGPSIVDPSTGEIISATANIYITPIKSNIVNNLRRYVRAELGLFDRKAIAGPSVKTPAESEPAIPAPTEGASLKHVKGPNGLYEGTFEAVAATPAKVSRRAWDCDQTISIKHLIEDMKLKCGGQVDAYVAKLRQTDVTSDIEESKVLGDCAEKLLPSRLVPVLIHEIGHNLGLRHNFIASTDQANFHDVKETGTSDPVRSSSIMDYTADDEDRLTIAGKYDVAAIRFGYAAQVALADESLLTLDPAQDIAGNVLRAGADKALKPFRYCTDEDVALAADPLCNRFDAGTNPLEIVNHWIHEYQTVYAREGYRHDRYNMLSSDAFMNYVKRSYFNPLKRVYDEWRFHLAQYLGLTYTYLEAFDEAGFEQKLEEMKNSTESDGKFSRAYRDYREAAVKVYEFFRDNAFISNRYCAVRASDATLTARPVDLVEVSLLREDLYRSQNIAIKGCGDEAVRAYLAKQGKEVVDEYGYYLKDVRYKSDDEFGVHVVTTRNGTTSADLAKPFDVVGLEGVRQAAMNYLSARVTFSQKNIARDIYPNFIDEPAWRREIGDYLTARVAMGVSVPENLRLENEPALTYRPRFSKEQELITTLFDAYRGGLGIPNRTAETERRLRPYGITRIDKDQLNQAAYAVKFGAGYIGTFNEESSVTIGFLKRYDEIGRMSKAPPSEAAYFAGYEALAKLVRETVPTQDLPVNVGQFKERFVAIVQAVQEIPVEPTEQVSAVLKASAAVYQTLEENQVADSSPLSQLIQQNAQVPAFKALQGRQPLNQEAFGDIVGQARQKWNNGAEQRKAAEARYAYYLKYKQELDSQQSLLLDVLLK